MVNGVCPKKRHTRTANSFEDNGGRVCTLHETAIVRQDVGSVTFVNMPPAVDNHLSENRCTPEFNRPGANFRDVGFALFTNDPWYGGVLPPYNYKNEPPRDLRGLQKRREGLPDTFPLMLIEPGSVVVEDRNASRRATEEELLELGLVECESEGCVEEYAEAGLDENGEPTLADAPASCTSEISSLETGEVFYGTHNGSPGAEASPAGLSGVRGSPLTVMDTATAHASLPTGAVP